MNLREALEAHEADYNLKMVADHHVAVLAAARRFLALTETGPDYEAAVQTTRDMYWVTKYPPPANFEREVKAIVDAALDGVLNQDERT